jgi:hypothetical protein
MVKLLTHGWNLARAAGQRADVPDDLIEKVLTAANASSPTGQQGRELRSPPRSWSPVTHPPSTG